MERIHKLSTDDLRDRAREFWNQDNMMYRGDLTEDWIPAFSKNRDSDLLEESNFDVYKQELINSDFESGEDWTVETFSHWAVGSITYIFVRAFDESGNLTNIMNKIVSELSEQLASYPILDEEHYSNMKRNKQVEYLEHFNLHGHDIDDVFDECYNVDRDAVIEAEHEGWVPDDIVKKAVKYLDLYDEEFNTNSLYIPDDEDIGGYEIQIHPNGKFARYRHTQDMKVSDWKPITHVWDNDDLDGLVFDPDGLCVELDEIREYERKSVS